MRHNKKFNHLGRTSSHRKATLANMAASLVIHKRIKTTTAKAKALRMYVEPLITKSKEDSTHSRRVVFSYLKDKDAVTELFRVVAPAVGNRPGGYTRILKTGFRLGDAADMCFIELVDFNETYREGAVKASGAGKTRTRRSGGAAKASGAAEVASAQTESAAVATEGGEATKPAVKKAPAKAAAKKPVVKAKPVSAKTSGSKAAAGRSMASKKG